MSTHTACKLKVVDTSRTIVEIPEWFHGCELNFAENLLKHPDDNKVALITHGEGQVPGYITFGQLKQRVGTIAAALRANGVTRGDRVCGYLPNSHLAVEAMLATASIGAVWSSTSPDFGVTVRNIFDGWVNYARRFSSSVHTSSIVYMFMYVPTDTVC